MAEKILTVSVAAYNVQKFIRECLDSLIQEDVLDKIEVFVIDDGGKDQTLAIAKEYEEKYPGSFFAVHKENGGWGSTVNTGIAMANGKYFKQLDGDDCYMRENLSGFIRLLSEIDVDIVVTPWREFDDKSGATLRIKDPAALCQAQYEIVYTADQLPDSFYSAMHGCTFKTEMLRANRVSIMEHTFYTDNSLVAQGIIYAKTFYFHSELIYQYRLGLAEQSVSAFGMVKHYKDHEKVIRDRLDFLEQTPDKANVRFLSRHSKGAISVHYHTYFLLDPTEEHKNELKAFDLYIKERRFDVYKNAGEVMTVLRLTNYRAYKILCRYTQWRKEKKTKNG